MTSSRLTKFLFLSLAASQIVFTSHTPSLAHAQDSPASSVDEISAMRTELNLLNQIVDLQADINRLQQESQIQPLTTSDQQTLEREEAKLQELLKTTAEATKAEAKRVKAATKTPSAPSGTPPSNAVPGLTNVGYTDIACRPKLDIGASWLVTDPTQKKITDPNTPQDNEPFPKYKPSDSGGEMLPKRRDCQPLAPLTRLILENSAFVSSGGYSNNVGFANASSNQLITAATDSYFLGVGYSKKPILKQFRGLFFPADSREAIADQGTWGEDFFWNAITMDASYSWGRQLQVKNQTPTESFNTRPFYSVSGTYTLDLEKVWIYATHGFSPTVRPADQGWYFGPRDPYYKDPVDIKTDKPYQDQDQRWSWPRGSDYFSPDPSPTVAP